MGPHLSRRSLLVFGAATASTAVVGCKSAEPPVCTDTAGLSPDEVQARSTLAYADRSTDPARTCEKCAQFQAAANERACGGCKLLKGPVSPAGTCKVFTAKS